MIQFLKKLPWLKTTYRKIKAFYWTFKANNKGSLPLDHSKPIILFLLPEAGISLYIKTFVSLAKQFKLKGYQVYFARCFQLFERCVFMDSENLPLNAKNSDKKVLCAYCFKSFANNVMEKGFDCIDLRQFSTKEDKEYIQNIIAEKGEQIFEFVYEGVDFTRFLKYNFFLFLKKSDLSQITSQELKLWQQYLISLFVGYQAVKRLTKSVNLSHIFMCDEYSFNMVVNEIAKKENISFSNLTFPFHKDIDTSKIKVLQQYSQNQSCFTLTQWPKFSQVCLSSSQLIEAVDDLIIKMSKRGVYSYSPSKSVQSNILEALNLDDNRKIIVAYPSSPDELDAMLSAKREELGKVVYEDAFKDQFEWLDDLISFTEESADFQLIIRLHPRMAPNHREKRGCVAAANFAERYAKKYRFVKIIWPQDPISSFDLAEIADIVTVSWSSMGIFMARLGIPVISGLKYSLPIPNEQFHVFCQTKPEFFARLKSLANMPFSLDRLKQTYRWYNMMTLGFCIDLKDILIQPSQSEQLCQNVSLLENALIKQKSLLEINLECWYKDQDEFSEQKENEILKIQLLRLIHFLITNRDDFKGNNMIIEFSAKPDNAKLNTSALFIEHNFIEYIHQDQRYVKYSPLIVKMAKIVQNMAAVPLEYLKLVN